MYEATDRPAGRGRAGDVRDLELRAAGPRVAAQPGLLGQRRVFRRRRGRGRYVRGVRSVNTRDLPATSAGSKRASRRPARPRTLAPRPRARETAVLMLRRTDARHRPRASFRERTGFEMDRPRPDRPSHDSGTREISRTTDVACTTQPRRGVRGRCGALLFLIVELPVAETSRRLSRFGNHLDDSRHWTISPPPEDG